MSVPSPRLDHQTAPAHAAAPATHVELLSYDCAMDRAFDALLQEFEIAFRSRSSQPVRLHRAEQDFAVFRIGAARVTFAYRGGRGGRSLLAVGVSFAPETGAEAASAERRASLCRSLVAQIVQRHPAADILSHEIAGTLDHPALNLLTEAMALAAPSDDEAAQPGGERILPFARAAADRIQRLLHRPLTPRGAAAAPGCPGPMDPANLGAEDGLPMLEEAARIRAALYAPEAQGRPAATGQRLGLYAINLALVATVAPVGAALLTYNALGRENLTMTVRVLALTATGVAISQALGSGTLATIL